MKNETGRPPDGGCAWPSRLAWGAACAAAVLIAPQATTLIATGETPAAAAGWVGTHRLLADLRREPAPEASVQALYDRIRSGALDASSLSVAAEAMWTIHSGVEDSIAAGGSLPISLSLWPPSVTGDVFAANDGLPELEWRVADVRIGRGPAIEVADPPTRTPLSVLAPTISHRVAVPDDVPPGPTEVRVRVEFAVRPSPDGPVVGRWRRVYAHVVNVRPAASEVSDAR